MKSSCNTPLVLLLVGGCPLAEITVRDSEKLEVLRCGECLTVNEIGEENKIERFGERCTW